MSTRKIVWLSVLGFILLLAIGSGLDLAFGWFHVYRTKTVEKAQQNANREVFEQTQSYVFGKRQEALKAYKEWQEAKTKADKKAIEAYVAMNFAYFDEDKYLQGELHDFVKRCKYETKVR